MIDIFDELKVKDEKIRFEFELEGYKFWVKKGAGFIRKKVPATQFLASCADEVGHMTGKYDAAVEYLMDSVLYIEDDKKAPVPLGGDAYWTFLDSIEEVDKDGNLLQMAIATTLPQAVATIIVGKKQFQSIVQSVTTSEESTEQSDKVPQNPEITAESQPNSREPARALPKGK